MFIYGRGLVKSMNIFVDELARDSFPKLQHHENKLVVEDNIGEAIHIHMRDIRLEMSIQDFLRFSEELEDAGEVFRNGYY